MTCLRDSGKRSFLPELPSSRAPGDSPRRIPGFRAESPEPGGAARRPSRTPERKSRTSTPERESRTSTPERKRRSNRDAGAEQAFLELACAGDAAALALLLRRTPALCMDNAGVLGTAILYAAKNLDLATFKVLYTYGADTNVRDALAQSWEDKARASGRGPEEIAAFLKQATLVAGPSSAGGLYLVPFRRQRQR